MLRWWNPKALRKTFVYKGDIVKTFRTENDAGYRVSDLLMQQDITFGVC